MAARSYRSQGLWSWLAYTLAMLGIWVHADRGATDQAIAAIDESLAVIPDRRQQRAVILTFRAEILDLVGRYEEAAADLAEADDIAQVIGDVRVRAYVGWERARALSQQGDGPGTLAAIHAAESFRADWFDGCGGEFLADAADFLDRVGYPDLALQYLDRAGEQSEHEDFEVERATVAILARSGDPEEAETPAGGAGGVAVVRAGRALAGAVAPGGRGPAPRRPGRDRACALTRWNWRPGWVTPACR